MGDSINRQALLAEYDRLHVGKPGRARKMIEDAPSVQPERKTGKWIPKHSKYCRTWECSKCGYRVDLEDGGIYNFCSACGADMRGEQDDSI